MARKATSIGPHILALIEDARWRTSARGNRYLMMTLSDQSGQVPATCFDEATSKALEDASREGECGLLTAELDRRSGEDSARVTVRRIQPLSEMAASTRLVLEVHADEPEALAELARLLGPDRDARGEVRIIAPLPDGGEARVTLGRTFRLDAEIAGRIDAVPGLRETGIAQAERQLQLAG